MIRKENLKEMLQVIGYKKRSRSEAYEKKYAAFDCVIEVDFKNEKIKYPEDKGMKITRKTTCNFTDPENFVVLECITRLMDKGYRPEHIELEREWTLGHEKKSGYADILVKDDNGKTLFIIECKTDGAEYKKEYNNTLNDGGQIFSYWQQERSCKWLALYASNFDSAKVSYTTDSVDCSDDANILLAAKKDPTIRLYRDAHTVEELFAAWDETYEKRMCGDIIFREDSQAYNVGVKPLRKADLKDFSENDKIVNRFEEILRHNNVSDKENAFNRLTALFICKLVDEIQKGENDIVDFQYKVGTDTYESMQDRLQRLHKEGMEKFMREEIFYVPNDYAENLVQQYTGQKRQKMIEDLKATLRILKFYTNNDFAFKDVHNEELFYQNGKILVEVVKLFENYRIIGSNDVQMLGDLFEQLLNKGFKQNEGQFFTPIPITRFIWDSLPLERIIKKDNGIEFPKIVDYACGAGHFLTQGFEAVNACVQHIDSSYEINRQWAEHKLFGIEKDYRLARVSKISLFMHGAGDGNIIFGDGLENYPDKEIMPGSFDILVANPPYAVKAFKPHLKLKDNEFEILDKISNDGSEIETLFVERIAQLVKPNGIAAVILPSALLNKENESFVGSRESLLKNFRIHAIAQMGSKTFGATGTNTAIVFLEKYNEPPKRLDLVIDSVSAIFAAEDISDWEDNDILNGYLNRIDVTINTYLSFVKREKLYFEWKDDAYFKMYEEAFMKSSEVKNKIKQKTFKKLSEDEKNSWLNQRFYDYVTKQEQEKITYFALVYKQTTLIINAPNNNKAQEKFLGYKWSNRKGQEGIQIISPGGMLYDNKNRYADNKAAGLIRNIFCGKEYVVSNLEKNTYYLRLQDMLDFTALSFKKSLKTTRAHVLKIKPGFVNYKLNDKIFDVTIGDRVLSDEIEINGEIPIFSANVFEEFGRINKKNITDFSVPSIIWGIDGDWMVNCIPANKPFYPTDHCGVLRLNTKDIIPDYMAIALQVEGEYEKFSRYNRASIQRIKSLTVQIPDIKTQQKIVDEIGVVNEEINRELHTISRLSEDIEINFMETFGSHDYPTERIGSISEPVTKGTTPTTIGYDFVNDGVNFIKVENITATRKIIKDNLMHITQECHEKLNRSQLDEGDILFSIAGAIGRVAMVTNEVLPANTNQALAIIRVKKGIDLQKAYLIAALASPYVKNQYVDQMKGIAQMNLTLKNISDLEIPIPPKEMQVAFSAFVRKCEKLQSEAQARKEKLMLERKQLIDKYFRQTNE